MSFFGQSDFYTRVALGLIKGAVPVPLVVGRATVGTTFKDVSDFGDMVFPTAGETWEVVSDSAADTGAGAGARTLFIHTYDANLDLLTPQIITMNGTTPVALTGSHFRVRLLSASTSGTAGAANTGTITLRVSGAGATRSQILPGNGSSFNSFYTVPNGKTAILLQTATWAAKGEDFSGRSRVRNNTVSNPSTNVGAEIPVYQNSVVFPTKTGRLPQKFDFWVQAKTPTGSAEVITVSELVEFDNADFGIVAADQVISIP